MKKFFTSIMLMLAATVCMNAQDNVWILGNVGDQQWEPSIGTLMENEGDGIYTYKGHFNVSSYFSFTTQLAETAGDWDAIRPFRFGAASNNYEITDDLLGEIIACGELGNSADNAFLFSKGGEYEITLMIDGEDRLVSFTRTSTDIEPDPVDEGNIYILGKVNGKDWSTNDGVLMEKYDNNIYGALISVADSAANFSFTHALAQSASNWSAIAPFRFAAIEGSNEVVLGEALPVSEDGVDEPSFSILAGYYKLTLDMNARTLLVEEAELEDAMYIIGNEPFGNWDPANPMKMTKTGNVYTAEATLNGDVWFVFSDAFGSWDAVNARRFGPESAEEDQVVEVGQDVTTQLSTGGKSYKITATGDFIITFDKENLTFKFEDKKAGLRGDLNNDGQVDVTDVSICIDMVLGKQTPDLTIADLTGDGMVDVADVSAIIDIVLGK